MRHRGLVRRTLLTLHGTISFVRPRRRCDRCERERYPLDELVCFDFHGVSWRVAATVCRLASLLPSYDLTRRLLEEDYGIELSKHSIEQIVLHAGEKLLEADDAVREVCFANTEGRAEAVLRLRAAQYDQDFRPLWDARLCRAAYTSHQLSATPVDARKLDNGWHTS